MVVVVCVFIDAPERTITNAGETQPTHVTRSTPPSLTHARNDFAAFLPKSLHLESVYLVTLRILSYLHAD